MLKTPGSEIRTTATVRLLLELLADVKYKYFANESYSQKGPIRAGVDEYMKSKTLPPVFDPKQTDLDVEEVGKRVLVRRYLPVLDFIRANPRYILDIGTIIDGEARDAALAQNFADEFKQRGLHAGDAGVVLLGAHHAARGVGFAEADRAHDPGEGRLQLRVDQEPDRLPEAGRRARRRRGRDHQAARRADSRTTSSG